ncbi:MAG TPA: hypothetical protein VHD83_21375 [Puia sp.]|nr:hypothetical protein [Puia sp.]
MTLPTQHIIRHLFQVDTLEEVPRQRLEELVEEYPSFGVGRYLLSRKLQAEAADSFGEETQKTNLYFSNPFWLQWLLQEPRPARSWEFPAPVEEIATEEWNAAGEAELPAEEVFAPVTDTTETTIDTTVRHEEEPDEVGWTPPAGPEQPAGPSAADLLLQSIAAIQDQRQAQRDELEASSVREEEAPPMSIAGLALEQMEEEGKAPEETPILEINIQEEISTPEVEAFAEPPAPETEVQEEIAAPGAETHEETPTPEATAPIEIPAPEEEAPAAPIFEPYHTVDYFASQGIRLVLEENPSDRLGKQLKSFTDWLKVMRRLPQKNKEIVPDIAAERQVQAIAAHSIEGREIVTEAMAEVLAKQGMREKATEMYRKLSLLEPEKSAYFANKIEQLKII